ncbi:MAG: hypothetical protein ACQEQI_00890 [Bacillota bacterium]
MQQFKDHIRGLTIQIESLEEMIAVTEEFYGFISDELPKIESNIDDTIEEAELLINYFTDTEENKQEFEEGFQIREIMEEMQSKINSVYDSLSARENIAQILQNFVTDNDEAAQFSQILGLIDELNTVLSRLENLSMNAVIFSVKSDKEGAAFRVISDEINELSGEIQTEYSTVKKKIINLQEWNNNFASDLEDLITTEDKIANEYQLEIKQIFSDVLDSLQTTSDILKDFMCNIQQAVEPIYEIIVLLQNQDIIRQNLENLINILTTLQEELDNFNFAEEEIADILDMLVFSTDTAQLSQQLMSNILNQLDESLFDIQAKFEQMDNNLVEIEEEGDELVEFFTGERIEGGEVSQSSVDLIYQQLVDFVPDLIEQLEELDQRYKQLTTEHSTFYDNMEGLQKGLADIDKIADRFKKIEVLAKIEYTKISDGDTSFIEKIEDTIEAFIESSQHNRELYLKLKKDLVADYEQFVELSKQNQKEINQSAEIIAESEEKLLLTKQLIKDAILGLHSSSKDLISQILVVNDKMDKVYQLERKGEAVIEFLAKLEEESKELKEEYLAQLECDEWSASNQRLQRLEDKFTSYLERKIAQKEVTDLNNIDTGSAGGELTLF